MRCVRNAATTAAAAAGSTVVVVVVITVTVFLITGRHMILAKHRGGGC